MIEIQEEKYKRTKYLWDVVRTYYGPGNFIRNIQRRQTEKQLEEQGGVQDEKLKLLKL